MRKQYFQDLSHYSTKQLPLHFTVQLIRIPEEVLQWPELTIKRKINHSIFLLFPFNIPHSILTRIRPVLRRILQIKLAHNIQTWPFRKREKFSQEEQNPPAEDRRGRPGQSPQQIVAQPQQVVFATTEKQVLLPHFHVIFNIEKHLLTRIQSQRVENIRQEYHRHRGVAQVFSAAQNAKIDEFAQHRDVNFLLEELKQHVSERLIQGGFEVGGGFRKLFSFGLDCFRAFGFERLA